MSFEWNAGFSEEVLPFTNTFSERRWNPPLGFRSALTRVINKYSAERVIKNKITLSGEDIKEGLTAVLSIKNGRPNFLHKLKIN